MLRVEVDGPHQGQMAYPCLCGYHTDPDDNDVALIRWFQNGNLMFVHRGCIKGGYDNA